MGSLVSGCLLMGCLLLAHCSLHDAGCLLMQGVCSMLAADGCLLMLELLLDFLPIYEAFAFIVELKA